MRKYEITYIVDNQKRMRIIFAENQKIADILTKRKIGENKKYNSKRIFF